MFFDFDGILRLIKSNNFDEKNLLQPTSPRVVLLQRGCGFHDDLGQRFCECVIQEP